MNKLKFVQKDKFSFNNIMPHFIIYSYRYLELNDIVFYFNKDKKHNNNKTQCYINETQ